MSKFDIFSMANEESDQHESTGALAELDPLTKEPSMFKVILLNDDFTPMDFVIDILKKYFDKDHITATEIMLNIHQRGKGICGLYPYDIAETKSVQVIDEARRSNHPLQCTLEQA